MLRYLKIKQRLNRITTHNLLLVHTQKHSVCVQHLKHCSKMFKNPKAKNVSQKMPLLLWCNFYPRDAMLARVIVIATCPSVRLSVHPSVCLSVTRRYCVKTKKASSMISSPSGSPKTLVFWRQISSPNSKGSPRTGGLKHGSVGKIQRFSTFKLQYLENGSRYGRSYY